MQTSLHSDAQAISTLPGLSLEQWDYKYVRLESGGINCDAHLSEGIARRKQLCASTLERTLGLSLRSRLVPACNVSLSATRT